MLKNFKVFSRGPDAGFGSDLALILRGAEIVAGHSFVLTVCVSLGEFDLVIAAAQQTRGYVRNYPISGFDS